VALDLANIQGNIVPGFRKDHQAFIRVTFADDQELARTWLADLKPDIASALEVSRFNELFKLVSERRRDSPTEVVSASWVNVALSLTGIRQLVGEQQAARWAADFPSEGIPYVRKVDTDVCALLILGADAEGALEDELKRQRGRLDRFPRLIVEEPWRGKALTDGLHSHEPFGFKDLLSQPRILGVQEGDSAPGPPVEPGEFVLGYRDEEGPAKLENLPPLARDGSFLVFLQLEQNVKEFEDRIGQAAGVLGVRDKDVLAARMVGRYKGGKLVAEPPSRYSHIGRAYPYATREDAHRRRLLRRGIPYDHGGDGQGLFFLAYQADIKRQFLRVWQEWLNSPEVPEAGAGVDPVVGATGGADRRVTVDLTGKEGGQQLLQLPQFVTARYGACFFVPSLRGLDYLAGRPIEKSPDALVDVLAALHETR
jgi:deferrochelatase/peroxidase EfeB